MLPRLDMNAPIRSSAAAERARPVRCWCRHWGRSGLRGLASLLLLVACSEADPARIGADRFVDSYYVEIDLPRAREQAVGPARAKVERTQRLLEGMAPPERDAKPSVYYRMVEERRDNRERPGFVYELTISFGGGETIERRALVIVRQEQGVWRTVNFEELN